ncbi:hypothetical protein BJN34_0155 [Cupriavidus necator]|uniref:Uncharacterized protein n=1 Tax=Cupriavidus necator TaxID=106590 RepID=A0A2P1DV15_CUPNE|nr:hypothetical protein BJN34_0155 [Cupriavidus necator]
MGVITTSGDEAFGLSAREEAEMSRKLAIGEEKDRNRAARFARSPQCGLLLLYPISRFSGHDSENLSQGRQPLFAEPNGGAARDLIGLALSLPKSEYRQPVEAYLEGTAPWRPVA